MTLAAHVPTGAVAGGHHIVTAEYKSEAPARHGTYQKYQAEKRGEKKKQNRYDKLAGKNTKPKTYYHDTHRGHHHYAKGGGYYHHERLSRRAIRRILRHRGYHGIDFIDRRGDRYVAKGYDRRGRYVRVALNAYTGELLRKRVIHAGGHYGYHDHVLSVHKLKRRLSRQGFYDVHRIRLRNGYYYARSYDNHGHPVRLRIDARNGHVLSCDPIY